MVLFSIVTFFLCLVHMYQGSYEGAMVYAITSMGSWVALTLADIREELRRK